MGYVQPLPAAAAGGVLIHAVSLGEMNATPALVKRLQEDRPGLHVTVSATTDAGYDRGRQLYAAAPSVSVERFPLDMSAAIDRLLDRLRPAVVVLMELELWPNFMLRCARRGVPVVVVNGRLTDRAFRRYRLGRLVTRRMFARLSAACVQEPRYAKRFAALGVPTDRITVTGTMKFDTAPDGPGAAGEPALRAAADQLRTDLGLGENDPLWVAGSTGPGEEAIVLDVYHRLREQFPTLRLAIVPRHPVRFDEVAEVIRAKGFGLLRRTEHRTERRTEHRTEHPTEHGTEHGTEHRADPGRPVVLGDTLGELRKFYALATVVFCGRSLLDLGPRQRGSDMIEPAALGKPTMVGPWTQNFAEPAAVLTASGGVIEAADAEALHKQLATWLEHPAQADQAGTRGRAAVNAHRGATAKHAGTIEAFLVKESV